MVSARWRKLGNGPSDQPGTVSKEWAALCQGTLPIDPYLVWSDLTNFEWTPEPNPVWLPFLIETEHGASVLERQVRRRVCKADGKHWTVIRIPTAYRRRLVPRGKQTRFLAAMVRHDVVLDIAKLPTVRRMKVGLARKGLVDWYPKSLKNFPPYLPEGFSRTEYEADPSPGAADKKLVLGIVDDGCNFAHGDYRVGGNSRVARLWDQNEGLQEWSGRPRFLGYGRVLAESDMRGWLAKGLTEEEIYGSLYSDHPGAALRGGRGTHGTGALHLLAGHCRVLPQEPVDPTEPAADADVMFVQLPRTMLGDTSSGSLCVYALDAIRYLIDRAETYAPIGTGPGDPAAQWRVMRKVVINLSYGSMTGPHDASAVLDEAIEELVTKRGDLAVVVAAGNSRRSRCHAELSLPGEQKEAHVGWVVSPANPVPSTLEIWVPEPDVEVRLTDPHGNESAWAAPGELHALTVDGRDAAWIISARQQTVGHGLVLLLAMAPTVGDTGVVRRAPHGTWKVSVRSGMAMKAQVWVERNDMAPGRLRRQQSHLVNWDTDVIRTEATMCSPATSRGAVAVEAWIHTTQERADYSGEGWAGSKVPADARAAVDFSHAVKGMRVAGVVSGSSFRMSGTSAAAPLVARKLARWMQQQSGPLDWTAIRAYAQTIKVVRQPAPAGFHGVQAPALPVD